MVWIGQVWGKVVEIPVMIIDQMEDSPLVRDLEAKEQQKNYNHTFKKVLELNGVTLDMIPDRKSWHHLIQWENVQVVVVFLSYHMRGNEYETQRMKRKVESIV